MFFENYGIFTVDIIVHLKAQFVELLKYFSELVRWKMKEYKNIVVAVGHKNILIWFVKVMLKTLKCPLVDVHNNASLVKAQHDVFYERIYP